MAREQRRLEGLEAGAVLALFGEIEEPLLGLLDLRAAASARPCAS